MTDTTSIALNKLTAWEGNVRKTASDAGIDELAASIAAHGLLQSLVVRKQARGKHAVVAGRRRLMALAILAADGRIEADMPVPCHVIDGAADAAEISLAENVMREAMHPADEFEAFRDLADKGLPAADIAARFGVTETVVARRLKLANVSPLILKTYRKGDIYLEHVMAFAISDDHAAQDHVLKNLSEYNDDPSDIRAALTEDEISATDKRVKFVTLKAYEKAAGIVRRDLFSRDDEHGVFILHPELLDQLAAKKLEKIAKAVRAEGWKWVETHPHFDYEARSQFQRRHPEPVPLPASEDEELDRIKREYEAMLEQDSDSDKENPRFTEICARIDELEDRECVYTPEILAIAGAVISIGHDGKAAIERGLVRPEDAPKKSAKPKSSGDPESAGETESAFTLPAVLTESLTSYRTAALAATLANQPDIALAAVVHQLAGELFQGRSHAGSCLELDASSGFFRKTEGSKAFAEIERLRESWGDRIPGDPEKFWTWCLERDRDTLLDLLAFCAACSLNAILKKGDRPDCNRLVHADLLAQAVTLDMKAWFTPDAGNYFSRISKTGIIQALQEAKGTPPAPAWHGMKKSELALLAARETAGTGWLPELLRPLEAPVPEIDEAV